MISKMTKYSFILLSGDKEQFLERLGDLGVVDIVRSAKPVDSASSLMLAEVEKINGLIQGLQNADIPEGTVPRPVEGDILRLSESLLVRFSEDNNEIKELEREVEDLRVWGSFDRAILDKLSEAGVPLHFHVLSVKAFQEDWANDYAISVIASGKANSYFVVAGEDGLPGEIPVPDVDAAKKENQLEEKKALFQELLSQIAYARERIPELIELRDKAYVKLDRYLADFTAVSAAENTIATMVGYVPTEKDDIVSKSLDKDGIFYFKEPATAEDRPPISLKNNKFTRMFTVLTDMYGRPEYNGFDPTPYISVFFMLFFAFCMGDAGYGLCLVLLGLGLRRMKGAAAFAPLVTTLGVATVVIGFLFHTFFSMDISNWEVFEPVKGIFLPSQIAGYDGTMILALLVGILHICLAIIVKTIYATKNNGFLGSLGTWGWALLIVGGVVVGGLSLGGVLDQAVTKWVVIVIGILSALGIFFLNDLHRNPLLNVGAGLWETYNTATGLLGDVLSYLRLYALGLAGAMLGFAFNDLGAQVLGDGAILNWVFFILIVLIGHVLNMAMAVLGAFVHPLRLNFLEFFKNSGYEGGARIYDPLKNASGETIE